MYKNILIICAFFFIISCDRTEKNTSDTNLNTNVSVKKTMLDIGYGWSVDDDEGKAVSQAVKKMKQKVKNPEFVVLYTTVGYDVTKVVDILGTQLKNSKIFGITSCLGVITTDGVHIGKKGSLAIMGFASKTKTLKVGVGIETITDPKLAKQKTTKALMTAIENSGSKEAPSLVLIGSTPGFEERAIEAIQEKLGKQVPIYGGSAADNSIKGNWRSIANKKMVASGVSLAVIYTKSKIGGAFACGYLGGKKKGKVTKMKERVIYTIDGKPAGEVYNNWANGKFSEYLVNGKSILAQSSTSPLAKAIKMKNGTVRFISLHPAQIIPKDKSLALFGEAFENEDIYFTEGKPDILIKRASAVTRNALIQGRIKKKNIVGGLHIYCAGTMLSIKNRISEIVPHINGVINKKPFIGAFTFGEQGLFPGYGNFHGNLMNSMIVFGSQ